MSGCLDLPVIEVMVGVFLLLRGLFWGFSVYMFKNGSVCLNSINPQPRSKWSPPRRPLSDFQL